MKRELSVDIKIRRLLFRLPLNEWFVNHDFYDFMFHYGPRGISKSAISSALANNTEYEIKRDSVSHYIKIVRLTFKLDTTDKFTKPIFARESDLVEDKVK